MKLFPTFANTSDWSTYKRQVKKKKRIQQKQDIHSNKLKASNHRSFPWKPNQGPKTNQKVEKIKGEEDRTKEERQKTLLFLLLLQREQSKRKKKKKIA